MIKKIAVLIFMAFFTILFACGKDSTPPDMTQNQVKTDYLGKLYFISNHNYGCACRKKKSRQMDDLLKKILKNDERINNKIEVIRIEYLKNRKKADEVLAEYQYESPPALILVDIKNNVLFKQEYHINEEQRQILIEKIDELLFESNT